MVGPLCPHGPAHGAKYQQALILEMAFCYLANPWEPFSVRAWRRATPLPYRWGNQDRTSRGSPLPVTRVLVLWQVKLCAEGPNWPLLPVPPRNLWSTYTRWTLVKHSWGSVPSVSNILPCIRLLLILSVSELFHPRSSGWEVSTWHIACSSATDCRVLQGKVNIKVLFFMSPVPTTGPWHIMNTSRVKRG